MILQAVHGGQISEAPIQIEAETASGISVDTNFDSFIHSLNGNKGEPFILLNFKGLQPGSIVGPTNDTFNAALDKAIQAIFGNSSWCCRYITLSLSLWLSYFDVHMIC